MLQVLNQFNKLLSESCDSLNDQSSADTSFDETFSVGSETPTSGSGSFKVYDCQICSVKSRGITDHLKHLAKVHFKHKLLSAVPKSAPFRFPFRNQFLNSEI